MSEQQIDQIRQAVAQMTDFFRERGIQSFSDAAKSAFSKFLDQAADKIADLRSQMTSETPNIPQGADMLWKISGSDPTAFTNYLRTVPDPSLNALLTQPDRLSNIIDHLSKEDPKKPAYQTAEGIQETDLQSSNIWGYKYNPRNKRLQIRFNDGAIYGYDNVPQPIFDIFKSGAVPAKTDGQNRYGSWWRGKIPSMGAAFYQMIRLGGYPYQRLS